MEDDFRVSKGGSKSFLGISDPFEFETLVYCVLRNVLRYLRSKDKNRHYNLRQ